MRRSSFLALLTLANMAVLPLDADDLQGAQALLHQLGPPVSTQPTTSILSGLFQPQQQLPPEIAAFSSQEATLSPADAGQKWVELVLSMEKNKSLFLPISAGGQEAFQVIPGPASWPAIEKTIEAHSADSGVAPETLSQLKLLAHTLNDSESKQWVDLLAFPITPVASGFAGAYTPNSLESVLHAGEKLSQMAGNPDDVEHFWQQMFKRLAGAGAFPDTAIFKLPIGAHFPVGYGPGLDLPDFVTLLGPERAKPLLLSALEIPSLSISSVAGIETQALARQLALENVDHLTQAPWALTESLEGAPLYEALQKKFPNDTGGQDAALYYVLALVTQGRTADALKASAHLDPDNLEEATEQASDHGWGLQVYYFLHDYLALYPDRTGWEEYVTLAAQTGHATDALQFVKDTLARKDLGDVGRAHALAVLYRALLANNQVDDGIAQLRSLLAIQKNKPDDDSIASLNSRSLPLELETELARLGHLLQRPDLEKEGISGALGILQSPSPASKDMTQDFLQSYRRREFVNFLMEIGHAAEAEKVLIDTIVNADKTRQSNKGFFGLGRTMNSVESSQEDLIALAQIYYQAGRWNDVLTLLQQVPGWDASDLVQIAGLRTREERYSTPSLGLMAARAFAETGRLPQARTILDDVLRVDGGDDAAYELLLKIGQGDLVAKLDALYHQDQFENRPLIWKATVLLGQGKLAAAHDSCQAAIAVDPSDGQSGKGDRMHVYSVMAQIDAAQGDTQQAAFFGNVVKAIRLSESADDYFDAGLLTQSVGMYAHALTLFSNAYCIQSRIARQLAELGRMQEAAVHYRKAFELMPVSFGRLESHCFGCERAFEGKTAEDIAQDTFTEMLKKDPAKPQLHYLLGYLRMEEHQYAAALPEFVKATQLDPDYINAWKQITVIGRDYQLSPGVRDEAIFSLIRLDPAGRHIRPEMQQVRQLTKLWSVVSTAAATLLPAPASLLPLQPGTTGAGDTAESYGRDDEPPSPRTAILENDIISSVMNGFR